MGRLEGRTIMVTGAGRGLGRNLARRFVAEGAQVVATARDAGRLNEAVGPLGDKALAVLADLGEPADVDRLFAETEKRFGRLDTLINNAAIYDFFRIAEATPDQIRASVHANLLAPMLCARAAIPLLRNSGGGDIINVTSEAVRQPFAVLTVYGATKAGLENFSASAKTELRDDNIRVTTLRLGAMHDPDRAHPTAPPEVLQAFMEINAARIAAGGKNLMPLDDVATCILDMLTMPAGLAYDSVELRPRT
jgi:meso-butanediol dehydrogenase/(S,S)-butanediol dehydrogenase/diacetyl reductase